MTREYDHTDLPLHGAFTEDGNQYRLYTVVNGVEFPVQFLSVPDYREAFEEAAKNGENGDSDK